MARLDSQFEEVAGILAGSGVSVSECVDTFAGPYGNDVRPAVEVVFEKVPAGLTICFDCGKVGGQGKEPV